VRTMKRLVAGVVCVASFAAASAAFGADEGIVLKGGTRAVIEGRRLILIGGNAEREAAPVGVYRIRESNREILVTNEGVEVRTGPPEIR